MNNLKHNNRLSGLDGMRAIACLLIILHHVFQHLDIFSQHYILQHFQLFFLIGNTGVSFFLILSGFLLSYSFWRNYLNNGSFPDIKRYLKKRAVRLLPGYYASFIVAVVLGLLYIPDIPYFWRRLITGLTLTSGFHYTTLFPVSMNSPLWFVSILMFSILLLPVFMIILFYLTGKKRSFLKGMVYWIFVLAFILCINQLIHYYFTTDNVMKGWEFGIIGGAKSWMPNYNPVGFFAHFIFGVLASGIMVHLSNNQKLLKKLSKYNFFDFASIILLVSIAGFLWRMRGVEEFTNSFQKQPYYFPYLTVLIAGLLVFLPLSKKTGRILDNRFFSFTSRISYDLYIWHYLILFLVAVFYLPEYISGYMGVKDWQSWLIASVTIIILSYIIATLLYYFFEKPFSLKAERKKVKVIIKRRIKIRHIVSIAILSILALVFIFPLIWLFDASLRPPMEILQNPPVIFQKPIWEAVSTYTRDSYVASLWIYDSGRALFNSLIVTFSTLVLTALICSLYAYALVFIRFKGKNFFFILALCTMMIPMGTLLISIYNVIKTLKLINNPLGLILPGAIFGFGVFLLRQYFIKIPMSVIEAARMDGAGHFRIWWSIILPIARPALAAMAIIQFRIVWNDFLNPIIVLRDEELFTLPVVVLYIYNTGAVMATGFISLIIPLLLFLKFHKQFIEGITGHISLH
jgi:ABC-type glycerol-3-phosphate transport system permease component/peptidoglycan/LPS O-acetylase OafA/YrhL